MMEIVKTESAVHILSGSQWYFIFVQSILHVAHSFEDCPKLAVAFDLPVRAILKVIKLFFRH